MAILDAGKGKGNEKNNMPTTTDNNNASKNKNMDSLSKPPATYVYRGKTITNNGEWKNRLKHATLESLLKGASLDTDPAFLAEIAPFYDPTHPQHDYTVSDYLEVLDRVCDWLYPELTREAGREAIGRMIFEGRRKTAFGKVALSALHVMGPNRLMQLAPRLFETTDGTGKRSLVIEDAKANKYCFCSRGVSGTYEEEVGAIKVALETSGAKNVRIVVEVIEPDSWDYHIEWD
jgi:uncharacterized protein (TIGR02265 family)